MEPIPDIFIFLGRFHSLVVHLPIGFLTLAVLLEILIPGKRFEHFKNFIPFIWLLTAFSTIVSVLLGYSLSLGGGYNESTLFWHRFGGFTLIILSLIGFFLNRQNFSSFKKSNRPVYLIFILFTSISLIVTGHLGGSLTHGNEYLSEFAPKSLFGFSPGTVENHPVKRKVTSLDSADIFNDAVLPIIQSKCTSCHNKEKKKGGLLLTSYDEIFAGGKTREGITPGNLATSEIFRRITLPQDHKEFMPTGGKKPLTEEQVAILEWWIENGAQKQAMIGDLHPNKKMQDILGDFFQIGRDEILDFTAPPESPEAIKTLLQDGYLVNQLTRDKHLYEVNRNGNSNEPPKVKDLKLLKEQLVWLKLTDCGISDDDLKEIGSLSNLYKLNLSRNKISDKGIGYLLGLSKLEYLNLYGTAISDSSITALMALPNLKKLYVWETAVDTLKMDTFKVPKKDLEIVYKIKGDN
ncbi:DUF2231 domain-containing protein [Flavihumibacter profundi]|uniref:DUF2231 domain-containing protein n=1 Tax=Flavihumibacter profundi TaxID=2716883 RepID=UPI001CC5FC64|nr:DUF2231 domain-containing protein [Flavihumibacter profundi]MBZ5856107.1 hypothetical protein [Flavihumibacter profundi]